MKIFKYEMLPIIAYVAINKPLWIICINGIQVKIKKYKYWKPNKYENKTLFIKVNNDILWFIEAINGIVIKKHEILINNDLIILLFKFNSIINPDAITHKKLNKKLYDFKQLGFNKQNIKPINPNLLNLSKLVFLKRGINNKEDKILKLE